MVYWRSVLQARSILYSTLVSQTRSIVYEIPVFPVLMLYPYTLELVPQLPACLPHPPAHLPEKDSHRSYLAACAICGAGPHRCDPFSIKKLHNRAQVFNWTAFTSMVSVLAVGGCGSSFAGRHERGVIDDLHSVFVSVTCTLFLCLTPALCS